MLIIKSNLFNKNTMFLVEETHEYIFEKQGWFITITVVIFVHFFGRYILVNIIVAFMKQDISDTRVRLDREAAIEREQAEELLRD